jgi:phosphate starvation-inducible PhoH-like protein
VQERISEEIALIDNNEITICAGPAGTGKTFIACAKLKITKKQKRDLKKIILVKSVTILEGEDVGFFERRFKRKRCSHLQYHFR